MSKQFEYKALVSLGVDDGADGYDLARVLEARLRAALLEQFDGIKSHPLGRGRRVNVTLQEVEIDNWERVNEFGEIAEEVESDVAVNRCLRDPMDPEYVDTRDRPPMTLADTTAWAIDRIAHSADRREDRP